MMKNKRLISFLFLTVFGLGLFILGLFLMKANINNALPYLMVGFGCGIFGHGLGESIAIKNADKHPEFAKKQEIEKNDERNIILDNKAKSKAYDLMIYVFGSLFVAFAFMDIDFKIILLLVGAYLFVCGVNIYYRIKYNKEM